MGFTQKQIDELDSALNVSNVSDRTQAGRTLSYIEGWYALAEANRIFGFDGWWRETVDIKCVSENAREIGQKKGPGFGVTYISRVRISVYTEGDGTVVREGCGTGHGIDRDLGQAHESAIKEAETDATKRALMTFGWPFGLALYDKSRAHVTDGTPRLTKAKARPLYSKLQKNLNDEIESEQELKNWGLANATDINSLPVDWQQLIRERYGQRLNELKEGEAA